MEAVERNQHSPFVKAIEGLTKIRIKTKKWFLKQTSVPDREKTCAYIPVPDREKTCAYIPVLASAVKAIL